MSSFDLFDDYEPEPPATLEEEKPQRAARQRSPDLIYNFITLVFLAATVACCVVTVALIQNPTLPINPWPPPTPQPTPTLFLLGVASTNVAGVPTVEPPTATPTDAPTVTPSVEATVTPTVPATPTGVTPLPGATNTPSAYPFTLQNETYVYTQHTGSEGCDYLAIAGQVFDVDGNPLVGLAILVKGDRFFEALTFSGSAASRYGPSGYEVLLNTTPVEEEFTVQMFSDTGMALSDQIVVRTRATCEENVVIVNFVQNQPAP